MEKGFKFQVWEDALNGGIPKVFNQIEKSLVSRSDEVDTSWRGSVLLRDIADLERLWDEDGPIFSPKVAPNSSMGSWPTTSSTR